MVWIPADVPAGVATFVMLTVWPDPRDGVTGSGVYVTGSVPPAIPAANGLAVGHTAAGPELVANSSAMVVRSTVPLNAWLRETINEPAVAVVPLVPSDSVPGSPREKSGISITIPG